MNLNIFRWIKRLFTRRTKTHKSKTNFTVTKAKLEKKRAPNFSAPRGYHPTPVVKLKKVYDNDNHINAKVRDVIERKLCDAITRVMIAYSSNELLIVNIGLCSPQEAIEAIAHVMLYFENKAMPSKVIVPFKNHAIHLAFRLIGGMSVLAEATYKAGRPKEYQKEYSIKKKFYKQEKEKLC